MRTSIIITIFFILSCAFIKAQDKETQESIVDSTIAGTYSVEKRNANSWIKLLPDGSYQHYIESSNYQLSTMGHYEMHQDTIILIRNKGQIWGPVSIADKYNSMLLVNDRLLWYKSSKGEFTGINALSKEEK